MKKYIIKRLLTGVLIVFGVIVITFIITRIVPSDPVGQWVGESATNEQREAARIELGLDKPLSSSSAFISATYCGAIWAFRCAPSTA